LFKKSTGKTPKPGASVTADLSLIGSSVKVTGSITTSGSIRVDGKVDGDVLAEGDLILGEGGEINGNVKGRAVNLGGKITGSVDASEKITLEAKCSLNGNISSRVLVIEPGAVFNGKSSMGTAESEK
jgi:cytoskeletal protein CcmA (bactofilin family)